MPNKALQWAMVAIGGAVLVGGATIQGQQIFGTSGASYPLTLRVTGVKNSTGVLRATICRGVERFPDNCELSSTARAGKGVTLLRFENVPEGSYAAAVFHDEDDDGGLGMHSGRQVPSEGVAFSNNEFGGTGVPSFNQAKFQFDGKEQRLRMNYMR